MAVKKIKPKAAGAVSNDYTYKKNSRPIERKAGEIYRPIAEGWMNQRDKLSTYERLRDAFGHDYAVKKTTAPNIREKKDKNRR